MLASIDRGSGPPVVLLHGQPGSGASWDPVTDLLDSEFRVLAPDRIGLRGHRPARPGAWPTTPTSSPTSSRPRARRRPRWWPTAGRAGRPCCWPPGTPTTVKSLVLVGAACTPDSLNALDRWLTYPGLGDVLTVIGLVGIGEVLPRMRRFTGHLPARYRQQVATALPDQRVLGGGRGALGRHRRTFMVEQRALTERAAGRDGGPRWARPSRWRWSAVDGTWWCPPGRPRPWPEPSPAPS